MDEEQNNKIDPSNFFESIQTIDKVANDALKKTINIDFVRLF